MRIFLGIWYVVISIGLAPLLGAMVEDHHHGLSDLCATHHCACTAEGYCDIDCCCAAVLEEITGDQPQIKGCAPFPEQLFRMGVQPHLMPEAMVARIPQIQVFSTSTEVIARPIERSDRPMKIPIRTLH